MPKHCYSSDSSDDEEICHKYTCKKHKAGCKCEKCKPPFENKHEHHYFCEKSCEHASENHCEHGKCKVKYGKDGRDGINGKDGKNGRDGKDGKDGEDGRDGCDGKNGEDGRDGRDGCDGKDGKDSSCVCSQYINTFEAPHISSGPLDSVVVYNITEKMNFILYGFDISGNPSNLYLRTGHSEEHENGIGFNHDGNEIDDSHFVQIDLADYNRIKNLKCIDPTIKIGSIQLNEGFSIYGSNTLGNMGTLLFNYTNIIDNNTNNVSKEIIIPSYNTTDLSSTGDLYKYGTIPFRYISIIATTGDVTLNLLTFNLCSC